MVRIVSIMMALAFVLVTFAPHSVLARENAVRNGLAVGGTVDYGKGSGDWAGGLNVRLRALDYTPLELEGGYIIQKGVYLKLNSYKLYLGNRFMLHLIDFGLIKWNKTATPFNNPAEARSVDCMLGSGLEVRIVKNVTLAFDLGWYLPNPVDVLSRANNNINNAFDTSGGSSSTNSSNESESQVKDAIKHVGDVYKRAAQDVHLTSGLRWYF